MFVPNHISSRKQRGTQNLRCYTKGFERIFSEIQTYRLKHLSKVLLLKGNKLYSQVRLCLHLLVIRIGWEKFMHMFRMKAKLSWSPWVQLPALQLGTVHVKQAFTTTAWKILSSASAEICSSPFPRVLFLSWAGLGCVCVCVCMWMVLLFLQKNCEN